MKIKKGSTLIEVLAALFIIMVITSLISTVVDKVAKNNKRIEVLNRKLDIAENINFEIISNVNKESLTNYNGVLLPLKSCEITQAEIKNNEILEYLNSKKQSNPVDCDILIRFNKGEMWVIEISLMNNDNIFLKYSLYKEG